ncbi:fumarylacetoacetate hydrolase family protein [Arhodomonas aquaeolei]|uniref:fumarylacetoacetate hydrolase family protein n=1 Tax=Arhodomonas aquaeolei TaxID=2369 RepID=UPI002166F5C4|nr:fumarylacetoacetate hydrolase family protein [Arhodomonas aquaeolei]MCS4502763.1 fumarylacetoacetate hydrolase family protein [Arhodomonas aquaeolei]
MRLVRFGSPGAERPGLLDGTDTLRDLSGHVDDIAGPTLAADARRRLAALDPASLPAVPGEPRLGPCVARPGKILGIGLNYRDHARETGAQAPTQPIVFSKAVSSVCGPDDDLLCPPGAVCLDWEVELAVVIGETARRVDESGALGYVAGYCVLDDVSERAWQKDHGGQFVKGKSHDTFCPLGPWLVTADAVPDPQALALWTELGGERVQDGTTADMIFPVAALISHLSRYMTLEPGDVIATGTPAGVGMGRQPPRYLRPRESLRLGVEGLGEQTHRVVADTRD